MTYPGFKVLVTPTVIALDYRSIFVVTEQASVLRLETLKHDEGLIDQDVSANGARLAVIEGSSTRGEVVLGKRKVLEIGVLGRMVAESVVISRIITDLKGTLDARNFKQVVRILPNPVDDLLCKNENRDF